ncbi:exonuclease domain-containing protein [Cellulomonas aerilata]|uniref:DNA polymerase III subunit epsilon n=1 Tax=Cellulomonas aerilata TaxID=515326 RepID=A0A512D959_9CELL|nr:exonuclease domain-containing protein [Cellulomonas aerilata]GEO32935.1 DNA polymerase III subunit epsilon [Cellulomonas aerilata]
MSWVTGPLLGLDTETTGVDIATDRVVTAALVRRHAGTTHARTWLLAPDVDIPPQATAIHGISTEHARGHGRPPSEALEEIATELADAVTAGVPVVAYNASFDLGLLEAELARHGLPTLRERLGRDVAPVLDPLVLDRAEDGARDGPRRLGDLCAHYGVASAGPLHTAEVDVVATLDLLEAIVRRYPHLGDADLATVHQHQIAAVRAWVEGAAARRAARALAKERADRARLASAPLLTRLASRLRSLVARLRLRSRAARGRTYRPPP